jgi:predicted DNA-binding transcriptional regulator YafY
MRADRLLSILLLLQAHGRMTAHALAERLEVCERTILRDMDALSSAGVPVVAERGAGGGWRLVGNYETKLTGLTAAEIQSLFLGRPPQLLADLGLKDAAEAAWLKLRAALPSGVREQAEFVRQRILIDARGWRDSAQTITSLPIVLEALWRGRRLRFRYVKAPDDAAEREVDPLGLVARGSHWYLVATRREAEQDVRRTYRVSRIDAATVLDAASRRPEGFDLAAHWEQSSARFRAQLPRYYATYRVSSAVLPWLQWYRSSRLVEEAPDGDKTRITMRFDVAEEALHFALSFGADLEVLAPPELRERVMIAAAATLAMYGAEPARHRG